MAVRRSLAIAMFVSTTAAPNLATAADWTGLTTGMSGGYGGGQQTQTGGILRLPSVGGGPGAGPTTSIITSASIPTTSIIAADGNYKLHGGLVGGSVGYNWQTGQFVYGLEGDASWADVSANATCGSGGAAPHACGGGFRGLGTVRGRLGYDISPALDPFGGLMIFASGGFAVAQVHAYDNLFGTGSSRIEPGWTAGGGFEALFGQHWSVDVEYLHIDLGTHALFTAIPPNPERIRTTGDVVRVGLNYHFNAAGPPALIAKY